MALETLTAARDEAAWAMDLTSSQCAEMDEAERPIIHDLGMISVTSEGGSSLEFPAFRAHSGPEEATGQGGTREYPYATRTLARETVGELAVEMLFKINLRGIAGRKGGKTVIAVDRRSLNDEQALSVMRQYENLMEDAGLVGYENGRSIDVVSADVGTDARAMSEYALERHRRHPEDKYWQAVSTAKRPSEGGLVSRDSATGRELYIASCHVMDWLGQEHMTAALQGFGNVGAHYAHYAWTDSDKRVRVQAIGERSGVLYTTNESGIPVTAEMVRTIGDNRDYRKFNGDKLAGIRNYLLDNAHFGFSIDVGYDTEADAIIEYPMDAFVPAAMGNVITSENVGKVGARKIVLEGSNGPTASSAVHKEMIRRGLVVVPDIWANGGGVDASVKEHAINIGLADGTLRRAPSDKEIDAELDATTRRIGNTIFRMAAVLETQDLRVAAAAVSMARLATAYNIHVDPQLLAVVA